MKLAESERLPKDADGPVFAEPWEAQAFAMAVKLNEAGVFGWTEWAETLGAELKAHPLRPYYESWLAALERLVDGKSVDMRYGCARRDRHGRHLAQLYTPDGTWVQGALLAGGFARVYSFPDNRAVVGEMLALEGQARSHRRGIWADPFYRVLTPDEAGRHLDTFQLVEGKVQNVAVVRGRAYLKFGADWRTDFTVAIEPADMRAFREAGLDPRALVGRRVRVRGWLKSMNGPMIQATHPEQIEILSQ